LWLNYTCLSRKVVYFALWLNYTCLSRKVVYLVCGQIIHVYLVKLFSCCGGLMKGVYLMCEVDRPIKKLK